MPALGGGITLENLPSLYKKYGDDVIYLLGGQLYGMSADLPENVRQLRRILERET
jgi:ribulose-bisphosphate carboxylase large chain